MKEGNMNKIKKAFTRFALFNKRFLKKQIRTGIPGYAKFWKHRNIYVFFLRFIHFFYNFFFPYLFFNSYDRN